MLFILKDVHNIIEYTLCDITVDFSYRSLKFIIIENSLH
jgi:hypothetical protein